MNITLTDKHKLLNFFLSITGNKEKDIYYLKNLIDVYPDILKYMFSNIQPDLSKVKYVKHVRYNSLKKKVLENSNLLSLNNKLNNAFDFNFLKKIINYYKNFIADTESLNNYIVKILINNPYEALYSIDNISFITADKILLKINDSDNTIWNYDLKSSIQRCTSFILFYLSSYLNGSTYIDVDTLRNIMLYKYLLNDCIHNLEMSFKDSRLIYINNMVMLRSVYNDEKQISNYIKSALYNLNINKYDINIEKYKIIDNFKLTNKQLMTLDLINNNQLVLLNGFAGTGKSSSIKALINMLEDNNKSYAILSPTAKAAKQIATYTDRPASTIHCFLCKEINSEYINYNSNNVSTMLVKNDENVDSSQIKNYIDYDVLIIDESSMLSVNLFSILSSYINCKRTKVLLIGDSYQLPSIQSGNLYQDLLEINDIPKVTLNEIFRYTEDGLINVATNIRLGKVYLNHTNHQIIGNSFEFFESNNTQDMINLALNKYLDLLNEGNNIQDIAILTAKNIGNSGTNLLNSCIQKIINPIEEFDDFISIKVDNSTIKFKENDIVMNIKNNYNMIAIGEEEKTLIANGQTGIIKSINPIDFSAKILIDDKLYEFEYSDICNLRLAYAFTVHKSQGSQFKYVIYLVSNEDIYMTNSNLMYVAVTRAQNKCFQFGVKHVINSKINERENLKRNTTLGLQYNNYI